MGNYQDSRQPIGGRFLLSRILLRDSKLRTRDEAEVLVLHHQPDCPGDHAVHADAPGAATSAGIRREGLYGRHPAPGVLGLSPHRLRQRPQLIGWSPRHR